MQDDYNHWFTQHGSYLSPKLGTSLGAMKASDNPPELEGLGQDLKHHSRLVYAGS